MSKGKKITVFSIVGVVLALVLVVIILACVPSYFNNFVGLKSSSIVVYSGGAEKATFVNNEEAISKNNYQTYLKLNEAVKNASSEKVLTALFQGSYKVESKLVEKKRTTSAVKSLLQSSNSTFLIFKYNEEQSVTLDGVEVKYYSIIMEVKDVDYLTETKVYFQKNDVTSLGEMESDYEATFLAKQNELYDLIAEIVA